VAGASWAVTPTVIDTIQTEGGKSAGCSTWTVTMHKPVVTGVSSAAAMNAAIGALVSGYVADFKTHLGEGGGAGPCTLEGDFIVGISSQTLVTIAFANQTYLGGASTGATAGSLNLISPTGATIEFRDLFTDSGSAATILSTQSRTLLKTALGSSADTAAIAAGTMPDMSKFNRAWVLTPAGLQLTFDQGQVGAAAQGTPTITVPWSALNTALNPSGPAGQFFAAPGSSGSSGSSPSAS